MINNILQFKETYTLPKSLLRFTSQPFLFLEGEMPDTILKSYELFALINGTTVASRHFQAGKFTWEIPLGTTVKELGDKDGLVVQFKQSTINPKEQDPKITMKKLVLSGFLKPKETLNVKQVRSLCKQQNTTTVCNIDVPTTTKLIELPILYYPKLLDIRLNGKSVPYQSVLYQDYLIAGITPLAGKTNQIVIRFEGLRWANIISQISFGVWILLLLSIWWAKRNKKVGMMRDLRR